MSYLKHNDPFLKDVLIEFHGLLFIIINEEKKYLIDKVKNY